MLKYESKSKVNWPGSRRVHRSIDQKIEWLKENPLAGEVVKKKEIPKDLDVDNLFKMRLARFWRMLYTIRRSEIEIYCFILVIEPHPDYDNQFKKKKAKKKK